MSHRPHCDQWVSLCVPFTWISFSCKWRTQTDPPVRLCPMRHGIIFENKFTIGYYQYLVQWPYVPTQWPVVTHWLHQSTETPVLLWPQSTISLLCTLFPLLRTLFPLLRTPVSLRRGQWVQRRDKKGCGEEEKGCGEEEKGCGEEKKVYFGATVQYTPAPPVGTTVN